MIFVSILFLFFQSNSNIIGKWEQINPDRIGFKETMEFTGDSLTIKEEFFSKNKFKIKNDSLKVTKSSSKGKEETIIASQFEVKKDTLIFSKKNGKVKDKMYRVPDNNRANNLYGLWMGRTDKGILTYLSFKEDGSSFYDAVIKSDKFKYTINKKGLVIFTSANPRFVSFKIENDQLHIFYKDTGEEFTYQRAKESE
jgi:hypothetical protein